MVESSETAIGRLLAARRSLRGTPWDGGYLDQFVQVLCRLDAERHGFAVDDLLAIEGAWVGEPGDAWSGGVVVRLRDGRRGHVDGRAGRSHWSEDCDIDAGFLDASQSHPELGARHGWQGHPWDDAVARGLNELLAELAAIARPAVDGECR